ncbi:hypothetical protein K488DRAFT_60868 [Vararia minispora EC-137]|uniref:Uncharacterized protein n=1 Tax=Vararia minispora EC-137 TaxID=1314806 RepID=A0ACB8Q7L1_9AGAM|nr:hypothetical protein K488DRAFT_60868 [Vararia minispora EC-137]
MADPGSPTSPIRVPVHRSTSQASWSEHHNAGTSYQSSYRPTSPSPRRPPAGPRRVSGRPHRSVSVGSVRVSTEEGDEDEEGDDEHGGDSTPTPGDGESSGSADDDDEDPITLKDRQSLINVEHPFGLRIWKPALYKKSRSVTRYADQALHSVPSAQAERHLLPANIAWTILFGWWLALACYAASAFLYLIPRGGRQYATLVWGLGWYLGWPFGKYVEGSFPDDDQDDEAEPHRDASGTRRESSVSDADTVRGPASSASDGARPDARGSWMPTSPQQQPTEATALLNSKLHVSLASPRFYGAIPPSVLKPSTAELWLGRAVFWLVLVCLIAPLMLIVCVVCWALVVAIPMARLNWALLKHLFAHPTDIRFCAPPSLVYVPVRTEQPRPRASVIPEEDEEDADGDGAEQATPTIPAPRLQPRLAAGHRAPSGGPSARVLLCIYRAAGLKYYKYTIGGVNIFFVNLLPIVFLVILDGFLLMPYVEGREKAGKHVNAIVAALGSRGTIFTCSLLSVIPLSYFIGMAVASISAQSSIGMGAVINATFGSIIEILLYGIALRDGKGLIVEGSIIGSILAGVLLMPGMSMLSAAVRKKEQKFNAKSAGVTSTMLIMAIIGTLTPTLFYQTYGNFQLVCTGCPAGVKPADGPWQCTHCSYRHPDPIDDPFYKSTVKSLSFFCAAILLFSYLVALWFSLRTHASQIWQNPQQLLHPDPAHRVSMYHKLMPAAVMTPGLRHKASFVSSTAGAAEAQLPRSVERRPSAAAVGVSPPGASSVSASANAPSSASAPTFAPSLLETVGNAVKDTNLQHMTADMTADLTHAIAVATVSALRQHSPRAAGLDEDGVVGGHDVGGGHGGHEAPSWSRTTSASVLLGCTALYAIIAELLVDVVDVVLEGSGIQEKFLGITLFALVPNTTEFMNAMSFAVNGNIALSMEIGSAYALQVCLLQIPAMVAFSAWYNPERMGRVSDTFPLIFPRWDVIVIVLSIFLLTYVYIEAKSNYHRGSILILSYLVLVAGFFYAPPHDGEWGTEEGSHTVVVGTRAVRTLADAASMFFAAKTSTAL